MNSILMPKTVHVDEEIKKQLLHEVKETLATGVIAKKRKRFTAAEMWSLNRSRRTASSMIKR